MVVIACLLFSLLVNRLSLLQAHQGKQLAHKMHAGGECAKNLMCVCTYACGSMEYRKSIYMPYIRMYSRGMKY